MVDFARITPALEFGQMRLVCAGTKVELFGSVVYSRSDFWVMRGATSRPQFSGRGYCSRFSDQRLLIIVASFSVIAGPISSS